MELSDSQRLSYLIENLTTNGRTETDKPNLKKLKSMCKDSNECLEQAFRLLFTQLEKDHSEIRLAAVILVDELFQRSHMFRELLLENFSDFLELAAGTNFDMPLPDPKVAAAELMKKTVKCVHAWHQKYGIAYKKLALGFNYLRGTKKIQLASADEVQTQIQRNALEERRRKKDEFNKKRLNKIVADIDLTFVEIKSCVAEMEACFSLIVPKFSLEDGSASDNHFEKKKETRESGIVSHDYAIELDFSEGVLDFVKINKNQDNEVVLENLRDRERMLKNIYLPKVKKWLLQLGAYGAPSELLKQVIDLKTAILKSFEKQKDLLVIQDSDLPSTSGLYTAVSSDNSDESSDDDDFEEVIEKPNVLHAGYAKDDGDTTQSKLDEVNLRHSKSYLGGTNVWTPIRSDDDIEDPASYSRALVVQRKRLKNLDDYESSEPKMMKMTKIHPKREKMNAGSESNIHSAAPVISFGPDLLEWDEVKKQELKETLSMGRAREFDIGHRFWGADTASKDDGVSEAALTALTTRSIAFTGEFEPVRRSCRAPLPSSKLCPRKDRIKCPFHGLIIPRDEKGIPSNPEDRMKSVQIEDQYSKDCRAWQDPGLLRELKAITGIDLKMPEKKGKKKKTKKLKYENLTNVRDMKNTSRHRLIKKVFDPKSIKRVSETLDKIETKRNFQKFGNNFNYALN